jgi:glyoxylase-like metal-dependent hydrolase (beta-lactamase superfamily II)
MKKAFAIVGGIVLLAVLGIAGMLAFAFLGRASAADTQDLAGIRIVKDGIVTAAIVPAEEGHVALIDAGNDAAAAAILAELARRNLGNGAVSTILLTHGHPDHTAGIKQFPNAQVMTLAAEKGLVEGTSGAGGPLTRWFPTKPTGVKVAKTLGDGETVTLGATEVRVFAVPGHTQGSAAYLVNGLLFLGDAADQDGDHKVITAPWAFSDSVEQDRASVQNLASRLENEHIDVKSLVFAHSGILNQGLAPLTTFAGRK